MTVNGDEKEIDEEDTVPVIINGRTLVPIRAIIEEMGGSVSWDSEQNAVTLNYNDDTIILTIDSASAVFNGSEESIDAPPAILNGRTFLPLRFISESFGFDVNWNSSTQTITISSEVGSVSAVSEDQTAINITIGEYTLTGYLNNTPEAEQFKEMLPVTVSMVRYGGREYYGSIESEIENSTEDKLNFENGDITYCPENNTVAIFYAQTDRPDLTMEVISMGMVTSDLSVFDELGSREDITFELA